MTREPYFDAHGNHVAWVVSDEASGATFLVRDDDAPVAIWDEGAGAWDVDSVINAQLGQPPEPEPEPVFYLEPQVDHDQAAERWQEGQAHEEKRLGRKLTNAELVPALTRWNEARLNGEILDPHDVFRDCERDGEIRTLNMNNREDRVEFMVRRLADEEALDRGDQLGEPPAPRQEGYDLDRREDRVARARDRIDGRISREDADLVSASGYNPAEAEWDGEGEWDGS